MPLRQYSLLFFIIVFLMLGYLVGRADIQGSWFTEQKIVFLDAEFDVNSVTFDLVDWQQLLGDQDKQLFSDLRKQQEELRGKTAQQQTSTEQMLSAQMEAELLMSALKANTWHALDGYQINQNFANRLIKIPGFIVPLETDEQRVSSFFIVPYFGACLHFPPPPPNQIIYVDLPGGVAIPPIDLPYMFYGQLSSELFEDPLGTSAWTMEILKIEEYQGDADKTRLHD